MTKFQKKKCLEAAEQKTSKLLVVVCCCKTVEIIISLSIEYARFKILQIQKNFSFFSLHSR